MTESDADYERTKPDFGRLPWQAPAIQVDVLEAIANMGGPAVHWRGGRILYVTGFELDSNDWFEWLPPSGAGNGLIQQWEGNGIWQPMRGSGCLRIVSNDVEDPATGAFRTTAVKTIPAKWGGNLTLYMGIAPGEDSEVTYIDLSYTNLGEIRTGGVAIDWVNGTFERRRTLGWAAWSLNHTAMNVLPVGEPRATTTQPLRWLIVRFLIETGWDGFRGGWINDLYYTAYPELVPTGAMPGADFENLTIEISHEDASGSLRELFVDDVILSQDEPVPDEPIAVTPPAGP